MSGGRLVVLDRAGRDVKQFPLAEGLATLGSDPACDIRIMLSTVSPHHATVVVHANQTVVRNVCSEETRVNGRCVSVAALRHGDVISIGGRHLRWQYDDADLPRAQAPLPALGGAGLRASRAGRAGRLARRSGPAGGRPRDPAVQLALEMSHRASMPGNAGGKQVAIVQPQRRDTSVQIEKNTPRTPLHANKRSRTSKSDVDTSLNDAENDKTKRKSSARVSPKNTLSNLQNTTKATLWIESRKTSPRKSNKSITPVREQAGRARRATVSAKKTTPLRLTVLKRTQSAHKMRVTKIEGPLKMDQTKQAAIRLMSRAPAVAAPAPRQVTILEITDSEVQNTSRRNSKTTKSGQKSLKKSTSPRKSSLKDPLARRGSRKTECIKFDLSNLESPSRDMSGGAMLSDSSQQDARLESYSVVDLVSADADSSVYSSAASSASAAFRTPRGASLLPCSTPYAPAATRTRSTTRRSKPKRSKSLSTPDNTEHVMKHISVNSTRLSRASRSRSRISDSDLLLLDDDDDSPRTSKRINASSKSSRFSAQTVDDDTEITPTHSPAQNEGICTPENRYSPEEACTPVLSIQSLLDSSQSSLASLRSAKKGRSSFDTKRKTIGGVAGPKTKTSAKSKSMSFSARKTRLRLSSDSVEVLTKKNDSEIVTPKSAVKLVQEGVKNKHSTAKKPQSKRSIIDDLNESDIVKQLFNSPVKRKLSQSMTEFSNKQASEESQSPAPDPLDHTDSYTPDRFVSPITTPTRSPSLDGIKLMFAKTTPRNDLRNVTGVKTLLRTPRTRRSIKNDLTNVSGVKNIFARSPKNRLSDVRIKKMFASLPNNDLRRVTGVKSLFQTTETRKSPRNELDDVRGVKKLFNSKSPRNDLRDVSGVKKMLRRNSPKNDLSDVRGVKRMFGRETRNDLNDVSGVEELFNVSTYSSATVSTKAELMFDQLVGNPQIKAVYSKTFHTKTIHKNKGSRPKSLHTSLDRTVNEHWLEQELNKRLQMKNYLQSLKLTDNLKDKSGSPPTTLDHLSDINAIMEQNLYKEQQINNYLESMRQISDSEANKSKMNKSKSKQSRANRSGDAAAANTSRSLQATVTDSAAHAARRSLAPVGARPRARAGAVRRSAPALPSARRSAPALSPGVLHSTPIKRRAARALDSSLARMSPITSIPPKQTEINPKNTRSTKTDVLKPEIPNEIEKLSPKKTRGRAKAVTPRTEVAAPAKRKAVEKVTRDSRAKSKSSSVKSKETSLAKSKNRSPANKLTSPVPVRTTRSRKKEAPNVELNTKKRTATLVVAKKSPMISPKPKASRKRKQPETSTTPKVSPKKTRATRKNDSVKYDKPKTPKQTRAKVQKATVIVSKPSPQLKPRSTRRGEVDRSEQQPTRKTRRTATEQQTITETQVQRKPNKTTPVKVQPKTKGRKALNVRKDDIETEKPEPKSKKGRKTDEAVEENIKNNKQTKSAETKPTRGRGKKVQSQHSDESTEIVVSTRGTRKRKTTAPDDELPAKLRKSKQVATQPEPVAVRGRKVNIEVEPANQVTGKRKRAIVAEAAPAKERSKQQRGGKKSVDVSSPVKVKESRATRADAGVLRSGGKPTGRSRRR